MQIYSFSFETDCVFQVKIKKTTPIILADYGSLYYFRISLRDMSFDTPSSYIFMVILNCYLF